MRAFVTGGSGFVGSHLVDRLVAQGDEVTIYDLRHPRLPLPGHDHIQFHYGDLTTLATLHAVLHAANPDIVYHLAARADVRATPDVAFRNNIQATFNVLETMRASSCRRIVFASSGSVYGETAVIPTPEDAPFPVQTSLYSASKVASEALIQAYCHSYGFQGYIFRFVSLLGERYSHGHVLDFYQKLRQNPHELQVLGNGHQKKSYLYAPDAVDAIMIALAKATAPVNIFNLGTDEYCEVNESLAWITAYLGVNPAYVYSGGERGWAGDNPFIYLDTTRICALGWQPTKTIKEAIIATVADIRMRLEGSPCVSPSLDTQR